ncbi:MAG TPA: alpha/beta hydrolase-fold protein [Steroidobacteraceae bacterium]|nr:alpha/beta hydrolase-fold protein [Steroidobacteraceae bacterium]
MNKLKLFSVTTALLGMFATSSVIAQVKTEAPPVVEGAEPVTVERIKVHSAAVEGNLMGESADRDVIVFLPPGYAKNKKQRYPVVYALHGYFISAEQWIGEIHVPQTIEGAFASGAKEMIVVFPNSKNAYNGSMYSSSATTGDFENFITHDVVQYIDAHYRTIPNRSGRGLVGHSMGGYGASRIGMKHADVFGSLYLMSPCCLSARDAGPFNAEIQQQLESIKSPAESEKVNFMVRATFAVAAAWSPNPNNPPLYLDLPYKNGEVQKDVISKWAANAPLSFVDQYIGELKKYKAISIDVGDQDGLKVDTEKLHNVLDSYHVANAFEIYSGDHTNHVAFRIQNNVIPFFSKTLCFTECGSSK